MKRKSNLIIILLSVLCLVFSSSETNARTWYDISSKDISLSKKAYKATVRGNWKTARSLANQSKNPTVKDYFMWREIVRGSNNLTFNTTYNFVRNHLHWPKHDVMFRRVEESMGVSTPTKLVIDWFANHPAKVDRSEFINPYTPKGKMLLAEALKAKGNKRYRNTIRRLLKESWVDGNITAAEERRFMKQHGDIITQNDTSRRISRLIWDNKTTAAKRLMKYVKPSEKDLFNARMALRAGKSNVDALIKRVPSKLQNDEGLIYDRIKWREKKRQTKGILQLVKKIPRRLESPARWWKLKQKYVRAFVQTDNHEYAYNLVKYHNFDTKTQLRQYAEAEWYAGWLALRFLDNPRASYRHFYNMYSKVETPISLGKAAYWAGRAAEANNNKTIAQRWYNEGARYPTSFYGQLATVKTGSNTLKINDEPVPTEHDIKIFKKNDLVKVGYMLTKMRHHWSAGSFMKQAMKVAPTAGHKYLIGMFGIKIGRPDLSVMSSKESQRNGGIVLLQPNYPLLELVGVGGRKLIQPEEALIHGIIMQESVFNTDAKSHAGARGLMQLMPATARGVAKKVGVPYKLSQLTADPAYNMTLGSYYLNMRIGDLNGSYILAIASYNAGIGNVRKWIKRNGDPRKYDNMDDVLDWLEMIPFSETQNYVQRVVENLQIFRYVLNRDMPPFVKTHKDIMR